MQAAAVRARRIAGTAVSVRESGYTTSAAPDVPEGAELTSSLTEDVGLVLLHV